MPPALALALIFLFSTLIEAKANNSSLLFKIISESKQSESSSLVIMQRGTILYSDFFEGEDQVQNVASITKSVCAIAIGLLIDQKKISSFDLPMSTWIPSWSSDPTKSKITLRMILNHTSVKIALHKAKNTETTKFKSFPDLISQWE